MNVDIYSEWNTELRLHIDKHLDNKSLRIENNFSLQKHLLRWSILLGNKRNVCVEIVITIYKILNVIWNIFNVWGGEIIKIIIPI